MKARDTSISIRAIRPLVAALAAAVSCGAWAEDPSPWYIGATQSLTHDSNVYRVGSDATLGPDRARADTYWSTGLVGGLDQAIGRQHVYGAANVRYNKYQDNANLTNTSYGLNGGWDWATLWNLSGGVNVSANQNLAQLDGNSAAVAPTSERNLVRSDQIGANVAWGGTGLLSVRADYAHSRVRYTLPSQLSSNSSADTGSIGTYYNIHPDLTAGLALRLTRTEQGSGTSTTQTSTSDGRNIDLSLNWRYTAQTGVNGRLSWTRQTNAGGSNQDFRGVTGSLAASYAPTAKLEFSLSYGRDAGTNGSFFNVPAQTGSTGTTAGTTILVQNSQVADSVSLGANYAATAKIGVNASYTYRKSRIANPGGSDYDDKLQVASLGANWAIARAWQLGCNLSHEKRDTTGTSAIAYTANVIGCSAQLTLR